MGKQGNVGWSLFRKVVVIIFVTMILAVQVGCDSATAGGTGTVELKLAHFFPATHPAETELVQGWAEAVKKATDGKVVITSYHGETLAKADNIYNSVKEGVADIGLSCFSYNKGRFPEMEAFEQPGIVYKNSKVASKVAWEGILELNPECVQDTKLMMVLATGPGDLFTKTKVSTLEELNGMQIRATGLSAETLALTGAVPVGMPQSDAYDALLKGVVAGNLAPIEVLKTWKHAEATKYLTRTPFLYNNLFYITMNLEKWNSLPGDVQKAITDITAEFYEEVAIGLWDKQNEDALKWAIDEQNMEVVELTSDETEKWIHAVEPMLEKYMHENGEAGEKAVETAKRLAEIYNAQY